MRVPATSSGRRREGALAVTTAAILFLTGVPAAVGGESPVSGIGKLDAIGIDAGTAADTVATVMARVRELGRQIVVTRVQERRTHQEQLKPVVEALSGLRSALESMKSDLTPQTSTSLHIGKEELPPAPTPQEAPSTDDLANQKAAADNALQILAESHEAVVSTGPAFATLLANPVADDPATATALPELGHATVSLEPIGYIEAEAEAILELEPMTAEEKADMSLRVAALLQNMELKPLAPPERDLHTPTFTYRDASQK